MSKQASFSSLAVQFHYWKRVAWLPSLLSSGLRPRTCHTCVSWRQGWEMWGSVSLHCHLTWLELGGVKGRTSVHMKKAEDGVFFIDISGKVSFPPIGRNCILLQINQ